MTGLCSGESRGTLCVPGDDGPGRKSCSRGNTWQSPLAPWWRSYQCDRISYLGYIGLALRLGYTLSVILNQELLFTRAAVDDNCAGWQPYLCSRWHWLECFPYQLSFPMPVYKQLSGDPKLLSWHYWNAHWALSAAIISFFKEISSTTFCFSINGSNQLEMRYVMQYWEKYSWLLCR